MKLWQRFVGVSVVAGAFVIANGVAPGVIAQDVGKEAAKAEKGGAEKKVAKKSSDDRLPANFGKIGLSDEQKKKIYAIQDQHENELKELTKKLAELRAKQQAEFEAVLTAAQRDLLKEHIENSKESAAKKKAAAKKKEGDKGGEDKPKS